MRKCDYELDHSWSSIEAEALLARAGYQDIRELRRDGATYRATASKGGKSWALQLDVASRVIVQTAIDAG